MPINAANHWPIEGVAAVRLDFHPPATGGVGWPGESVGLQAHEKQLEIHQGFSPGSSRHRTNSTAGGPGFAPVTARMRSMCSPSPRSDAFARDPCSVCQRGAFWSHVFRQSLDAQTCVPRPKSTDARSCPFVKPSTSRAPLSFLLAWSRSLKHQRFSPASL